jgi:hypothetical protein
MSSIRSRKEILSALITQYIKDYGQLGKQVPHQINKIVRLYLFKGGILCHFPVMHNIPLFL